MVLLSFCLIGLQLAWGLETTYCMPYLLELGLSKSMTTLVWFAGPLSGLVVAPVIGAIADNSKSKWGRRRPFMLGGSTAVAVLFIILAWAAEIVDLFVSKPSTVGLVQGSLEHLFLTHARKQRDHIAIALAVLTIYALDFSINIGMHSKPCQSRESNYRLIHYKSSMVISKSNCRFTAHIKARKRLSLGYRASLFRMLYIC